MEKEKIIEKILKSKIKTRKDLMRVKRNMARKYNCGLFSNTEIIKVYRDLVDAKKIKPNFDLEKLLRRRSVRTLSGVAPVAILTKPFGCPGKCAYCPSEKEVPQSYLSNEPAVMRAIRCTYNPAIQVRDRLQALINNGHNPTKIELIVMGGTWSYFPKKYKYWYILNAFAAANSFSPSSQKNKAKEKYPLKLNLGEMKKALLREQKINEKATYQIIGLTLETRPDYITNKEVEEMRELGCTRVELGVQQVDDEILKKNRRGHGIKEVEKATFVLKNYGFKITYHLMPGLPGSTAKKDFELFQKLFNDPRFQPDQIKFYPTVVTRGSLLYSWWKQGKYKPYSSKALQNLIIKCKQVVPKYVRIIRLIRDIPGESIVAGNMVTNLRQVMQDKGIQCNCIRCREAKDKAFRESDIKLEIENYDAAGGQEYFISFNSKDDSTLFGFIRLFLPGDTKIGLRKIFGNVAAVRELHVYGELVAVGASKKVQHSGLGKRLIAEAEKIAQEFGRDKMVVISGVGVRGYYRKNGYRLENTYMVKKIK
jgi:elongator complex protein 3